MSTTDDGTLSYGVGLGHEEAWATHETSRGGTRRRGSWAEAKPVLERVGMCKQGLLPSTDPREEAGHMGESGPQKCMWCHSIHRKLWRRAVTGWFPLRRQN